MDILNNRDECKEWLRASICILGPGRAGKTGLADSLAGRPFKDTPSTIGIVKEAFDINVSYFQGNNSDNTSSNSDTGRWKPTEKKEKEYESAIAMKILDKLTGKFNIRYHSFPLK